MDVQIPFRMNQLRKLPRTFYLRPTLSVARDLIGKVLVRKRRGLLLAGRIIEVEAYRGEDDPASHAYRGKTKRNEVMFWKGGHLYVYFTYGMHYCCNVVTEREGIGHAILLRALEPLTGLAVMAHHRRLNLRLPRTPYELCSGPARLCQAFAITSHENGIDLCGDQIWIAQELGVPKVHRIARSTRVGIARGVHHRWRFYLCNSPFVSPGKPSER